MSNFESTKLIPLTQGKFATVDSGDYEWLSQWKWHYNKGYAMRRIHIGMEDGKQKLSFILMHRLIMTEFITHELNQVDHIDGNRSNNCRLNLRVVTRKQNAKNLTTRSNNFYSQYKGVTYSKRQKHWRARITSDKVVYFLGCFSKEIDAALAYNIAAKKYHGEFACLNFIQKERQ